MVPALETVLAYKNEKLIAYFCDKYPSIATEEANQLFEDLLRWMWLTLYRKTQAKQTKLFGPLLPLDEIWHAFILHTRDYQAFCETYLGTFFHHDVELSGQECSLSEEELEGFLQDCFAWIGEAWVERYFGDFWK